MAGAGAIIGPLIGAGSSILGGAGAAASARAQGEAAQAQALAQYKGDIFQGQQEELMWQEGMLKAIQTSTVMTDQLSRTLSTVNAISAGRGADPASPNAAGIENRIFGQGSQDISRQTRNIILESEQHALAATYYFSASQDALRAGQIAASAAGQAAGIDMAGGVLKGLGGLAGIFGGG